MCRIIISIIAISVHFYEKIRNNWKNIKFIKCDISKNGLWNKEFSGKCYVFHLAALADIVPSIQNPEKYFDANVKGTMNILQASKKAKVLKF